MNKQLVKLLFAAGIVAASSHVSAADITVLPSDMSATPTLNKWYIDNFRDTSNGRTSTTTAEITTTSPRSGNGSLVGALSARAYLWDR